MSAFILTDLTADRNADFSHSETYDPFGVVVDVSLFTAQMMVRLLPDDIVPLLSISTTFSSGSGIVLTAQGVVTLQVAHAALGTLYTALAGRSAFYDVLLVSPSLVQTRFMQGAWTIDPAVTY